MSKPYTPERKKYRKVWGAETWICNTPLYCGKILYLDKGYRCSIHHHKKKDEVFYIYRGMVLIEAGGGRYIMTAGDAIRIPPNVKHRFTGLATSEIIEFSTQHFEDDSYRTTKSEKCGWFKKSIVDKWRKARGITDE
jgi:mannose-6-phosphate isomerase-like protein (cupin superfamily)